mgnify:CR=1 FL=1
MTLPKRFGIWGNIDKSSFWEALPKIISWSKKNDLELHLTSRILSHTNGLQLKEKKGHSIKKEESFFHQSVKK